LKHLRERNWASVGEGERQGKKKRGSSIERGRKEGTKKAMVGHSFHQT
jgi:hypothetical protein